MGKIYEVGGCVRDSFMNLKSKDINYVCEFPDFNAMREAIKERGGEIYLETPEYFTIRANVPRLGPADFVLARKDGAYSDGRRPDVVEAGTIFDDLARRDFTMNAIAKAEDGSILDPHDGRYDIRNKMIRAVGYAKDRFTEDSLRLIRAVRFSITKNMKMDEDILWCIEDEEMLALLDNISPERIWEELKKCFKHDTIETLDLLERHRGLRNKIFEARTGIWLKPTMENR